METNSAVQTIRISLLTLFTNMECKQVSERDDFPLCFCAKNKVITNRHCKCKKVHNKVFHGRGPYYIETSPLICCKSMDWFLYDRDLLRERVKYIFMNDYHSNQSISTAQKTKFFINYFLKASGLQLYQKRGSNTGVFL